MSSASGLAVRPVLAVVMLATAPPAARAESQVWNALFVQARTGATSGASAWLDLHDRRRADGTVFIVRPGLGYTWSPAWTLHAGYAFIPRLADEGASGREHRAWQHLIWTHQVSPGARVQVRGRLEQRFTPASDDVGHRGRLFLRGQWAWCLGLPAQAVAWDEVFVGLSDTAWGARQGFDQNRLFLGVGADTKVHGVRVEAGYLHVTFRKPADADRRVDHALMINVFATITP